MAGANQQLARALEQMEKSGASQQEFTAMKQVMGGFSMQAPETDDSLNAGALIQEALVTIFTSEEFDDSYPISWEDLQTGERNDITGATEDDANVDFAPECEKRPMMEF